MEIKEFKDKVIIDKDVLRQSRENIIGESLNGMMHGMLHGIYHDVVNEATRNKKGMLVFPLTYNLSDTVDYSPYPSVQLECKMKYATLDFPTSSFLSGVIIEKALEGIKVIEVDYPEARCVHASTLHSVYNDDGEEVATYHSDFSCTKINLEPIVYKDEDGRSKCWYLGRCPVCGKFYVCEGRSW